MDGYAPEAECARCKGRCCRDKGCSLSPEDMLLAMREKQLTEVRELLTAQEGLYAIDYFSMPEGACFYLRMKHKCYTFIGIDAMGECVALGKDGCMLDEQHRPKGGRYLEYKEPGRCEQHYMQKEMQNDWEPYQEVLKSIWKEFDAKFEEDGTFDRCDDAYFEWMREQHEKTEAQR